MDLNELSSGEISLDVLLTGMVITFVMLIILTFLIKIYGTIVYNAQKKDEDEEKAENPVSVPVAASVVANAAPLPVTAPAVESGIPQEVIAAIAAAVYVTTCGTHTVKSIKRVATPGSPRSVWGAAGLLESTRPF